MSKAQKIIDSWPDDINVEWVEGDLWLMVALTEAARLAFQKVDGERTTVDGTFCWAQRERGILLNPDFYDELSRTYLADLVMSIEPNPEDANE